VEKLKTLAADTAKALATLDEALAQPPSVLVRDATIQRFEYCFELTWKLVRAALADVEGVECESPKGCFRAAFKAGWLDEAQTLTALDMVDDRNRTTHLYREPLAIEVHARIPGYRALLKHLHSQVVSAAGLPIAT
jgi:nucleotidyltransferase substrate binding protein (TIGR01987 family)